MNASYLSVREKAHLPLGSGHTRVYGSPELFTSLIASFDLGKIFIGSLIFVIWVAYVCVPTSGIFCISKLANHHFLYPRVPQTKKMHFLTRNQLHVLRQHQQSFFKSLHFRFDFRITLIFPKSYDKSPVHSPYWLPSKIPFRMHSTRLGYLVSIAWVHTTAMTL